MAKKQDDHKVGLGIGLGAAVAAAVGTYFMYGSKKAAKNRKTVKSWVFKAKADVLEVMENAQEMTQKDYEKLIDTVGASYKDLKDASKTDMADFKREMKHHWVEIAKAATPKKTAAKKTAKKAPAKKTATKKPAARKSPAKK
jgi:hypothetical protein